MLSLPFLTVLFGLLGFLHFGYCYGEDPHDTAATVETLNLLFKESVDRQAQRSNILQENTEEVERLGQAVNGIKGLMHEAQEEQRRRALSDPGWRTGSSPPECKLLERIQHVNHAVERCIGACQTTKANARGHKEKLRKIDSDERKWIKSDQLESRVAKIIGHHREVANKQVHWNKVGGYCVWALGILGLGGLGGWFLHKLAQKNKMEAPGTDNAGNSERRTHARDWDQVPED
jgi:hypothetical protein